METGNESNQQKMKDIKVRFYSTMLLCNIVGLFHTVLLKWSKLSNRAVTKYSNGAVETISPRKYWKLVNRWTTANNLQPLHLSHLSLTYRKRQKFGVSLVLANLANQRNLPNFNSQISYCTFIMVHYWMYSKFTKLSSANFLWKPIRQTLANPNFCCLQYTLAQYHILNFAMYM